MPEVARRQKVRFVSESAIYGLLLVSALLVITGNRSDTSWAVLLKVAGTVVVFWIAHVFAHVVGQLSDADDGPVAFKKVLRHAVDRSSGLLIAAIIPLAIVLLGALNTLNDDTAVWLALIVDTGLLAAFGYLAFAHWTPLMPLRLAGAAATALLGIIIILMKAFIH